MIDEQIYAFNARQFDDALERIAADLEADIARHAVGLDHSPKARAERRRRVLNGDFQFFSYTYFPHHIRGTPSTFQAAYCQRAPFLLAMAEGFKEWFVAPRGEAKSTLISKVTPVYIAVNALLQLPAIRAEVGCDAAPPFMDYVILLGAESSLPAKFLVTLKVELTMNANLTADFPELGVELSKADKLVTAQKVMFEGFGAGQAIRGTFHGASRPKLLIPDDLITDEEAKSQKQRDGRWDWLVNAVEYLGPPDGSIKLLGAGTRLHPDDPIGRALRTVGHTIHHFKAIEHMPERMDLWDECERLMRAEDRAAEDAAAARGAVLKEEQRPSYVFYEANRKAMDAGAVLSWPEVRPLFRVMRMRAMNVAVFNKEMQGVPRTTEDKVFTRIAPWVSRLQHWVPVGGCDPSMGRGQTSDPSGLVVLFRDDVTMKCHVEYAKSKRRQPSVLLADLIALQQEYKVTVWGFENNNAYEYMRTQMMVEAAQRGVVLALAGLTATASKEVRIDSLEPIAVDSQAILVHASCTQLLEQLDTWPENQSHHHYDLLDALYLAYTVAITHRAGTAVAVFDNNTSGHVGSGYSAALGGLRFNQTANAARILGG